MRRPRASPRVHAVMARGFTAGAASYALARPGYPAALVRFARRTYGLGPGSTIVDLAAGTGKLTRVLLATGARVVAVEPLPAMRREFRRTLPLVELKTGTAERTGLPEASADAVTVAQAFHWFRPRPAIREIHRVLRPGGVLLVVYNERDETRDWRRAIARISQEYDYRSVPHHRDGGGWRAVLDRDRRFLRRRTVVFRHAQELSPRLVEHRMLSISYLAALPADKKAEYLERVRHVLRTHPSSRGRRSLTIPYRTTLQAYVRKPSRARAPSRRGRVGPRKGARGSGERDKKRPSDGRALR